ncbi:MAG TPA: TadE/TadG family type IV pilus assembly protein [Polyangia bacterium]|nr:TadE/TadG family type IV pilus assembly protein [Polyangia bacterium]
MRVASWLRRSSDRRQRGGYAVEFSLVIPLLLILLFGAIDGGRFVVTRCMLNYAVIVGSRMASMPQTPALLNVQNAVVAAAPFLGLTTGSVTVTITNGASTKGFTTRAAGDTATVSATYNYSAFLTFFSKFASRTFTSTSAITVE